MTHRELDIIRKFVKECDNLLRKAEFHRKKEEDYQFHQAKADKLEDKFAKMKLDIGEYYYGEGGFLKKEEWSGRQFILTPAKQAILNTLKRPNKNEQTKVRPNSLASKKTG